MHYIAYCQFHLFSEFFLCNAHERMWIDVLSGTCVITETYFGRNNLNISLFCLKTVFSVDFEKLTWFRKWCLSLVKIGNFLTISMFTQIILGICFKNKRCCFIFFRERILSKQIIRNMKLNSNNETLSLFFSELAITFTEFSSLRFSLLIRLLFYLFITDKYNNACQNMKKRSYKSFLLIHSPETYITNIINIGHLVFCTVSELAETMNGN